MDNYSSLLILISLAVIITVTSEYFSRRINKHSELFRKLLHFLIGLLAISSFIFVDGKEILIIVGIAASLITFLLIKTNTLHSIDNKKRKSWGIFFFALSYLTLLIFLFDQKTTLILSFAILVVSDPLAAVIGMKYGKTTFNLTGDTKSFLGSMVFFISSLGIYFFSLGGLTSGSTALNGADLFFFVFLILTAAVVTIIEAFSSKGSDNFFIPVFSAIFITILNSQMDLILINQMIIGFTLAALVAFASYRVKFLTADGSVATFLLAGFIFGLGGWKWSVPILTFFILSSILSKIRKKSRSEVEDFFEKSGVRDYWQVFANGGLGGILVIFDYFMPNELFYYMYLASLAAVCSDTWATEIGTLKKRKTYNILNLKPINQGMSGGISFIGLFAAVSGAITISISGIFWNSLDLMQYFPLIILSGILGSLFDSYLGATIQVQYHCSICNKITEKVDHCKKKANYHRGIQWINNDIVNLFAGSFGVFCIFLYSFFIGN